MCFLNSAFHPLLVLIVRARDQHFDKVKKIITCSVSHKKAIPAPIFRLHKYDVESQSLQFPLRMDFRVKQLNL